MRNHSILFIDHEEVILNKLSSQLGKEGYDVTTARSGEEALSKFEENFYDLVLIDLTLPGIGGVDVLQKVKALKPQTRIIIITGHNDLSIVLEAMRLGADDYLPKPFNFDELLLRIEKSMRECESAKELLRYKEIITSTTDMVAMLSPDYVNLIVNDAYAKRFNRQPKEIIGTMIGDLFSHEFFETKMKRYLSSCMSGKACQHQDFVTFGADETRFFNFVYSPFFTTNGQVNALVINIRDITEQNQLSITLQKNEERLRLALDISSDGVWDRNVVTEEVYYGENWAKLLGYTREELKTQNIKFTELLHPDDKEKVLDLVKEHFEGKRERYVAEFRLRTKGGDWQWVQARGKVVERDVSGQPLRFVGTHTDISARKKTEMELHQAYEVLEQIVEQRTNQLAKKNEHLEQLNTALTVLLKKRENDKKDMREQMVLNVKGLIFPYLEKLKRSKLSSDQKVSLSVIESNLNNVISPFIHRFSRQYIQYTPTEIQIANMVKDGMTSKEIAEVMNLSPETISNHRKHIRRKSGIANKKINLRTELASYSCPGPESGINH